MRGVGATAEPVDRPEGFDLAEAWTQVRDRVAEHSQPVTVEIGVEPGAERAVAAGLGSWIPLRSSAAHPGAFTASFPSEWSAAAELARLGRRVRVISPETVRRRLARLGQELVEVHGAPFGHGAGAPFGHGAGAPFGHGAGAPFGHGAGAPFGHGAGAP